MIAVDLFAGAGATWLATLTPGCQVRICTATTTRADTVPVTAITPTEIRCGTRRFTLTGAGIGSACWLEPDRPPRPVGRPRKNKGVTR